LLAALSDDESAHLLAAVGQVDGDDVGAVAGRLAK
jgi:hypothetical protein